MHILKIQIFYTEGFKLSALMSTLQLRSGLQCVSVPARLITAHLDKMNDIVLIFIRDGIDFPCKT